MSSGFVSRPRILAIVAERTGSIRLGYLEAAQRVELGQEALG